MFKILLDKGDGPEVIAVIDDRRVTRVGLASRYGETGALGVDPETTECLLTLSFAPATGVPTLQDVEAMQHPTLSGDDADARKAELAKLPSATNTGRDVISKGDEA